MPIRKIQELLNALETAGYSRGPSQKHQYAKEIRIESFSSSNDRVISPSIGLGPLSGSSGRDVHRTTPPHTEPGLGIPIMSNQQAHGDLDGPSPNHLTVPNLKAICISLNALESIIGKSSNSSLPILESLDTLEAQRDSAKTPNPNAIDSIAGIHDFLADSQLELGLGPFLYENDHFPMVGGDDQEFASSIANTQNTSRGQGNHVLSNDDQSLGGQENEEIANLGLSPWLLQAGSETHKGNASIAATQTAPRHSPAKAITRRLNSMLLLSSHVRFRAVNALD